MYSKPYKANTMSSCLRSAASQLHRSRQRREQRAYVLALERTALVAMVRARLARDTAGLHGTDLGTPGLPVMSKTARRWKSFKNWAVGLI